MAYKVNQGRKRCKQKEVREFKGRVNKQFLEVWSESREGREVFSWRGRRRRGGGPGPECQSERHTTGGRKEGRRVRRGPWVGWEVGGKLHSENGGLILGADGSL